MKKVAQLFTSILVLLIILAPFVWLYSIAFKNRVDIFSVPPKLFSSITLDNFKNVLSDPNFSNALSNSLVVAFSSTVVSLVFAITSAYSLSRMDSLPKKRIINLFISILVFPSIILVLPLYLSFDIAGLIGTRLSIILVHIGILVPFGVLILHSFFRKVSVRIDEVSRIHKMPFWYYFVNVFIPEVKNSIAITGFLMFLISWNEFLFSMVLSTSSSETVPVMIVGLVTPIGTYWGKIAVIAMISSSPIIVLGIFFRKYIVTGFTFGLIDSK